MIEHALLQIGIPKEELKIIITQKNFEKYIDPENLYLRGLKTLYKIHGSKKNLIKAKDTSTTLVATIQAFGSNKEGLNVFQVEPFKREVFENISKNRSFIIMGYSGSDDFDVVPTLKALKNIKNVIWINYMKDDGNKAHIFEINEETLKNRLDAYEKNAKPIIKYYKKKKLLRKVNAENTLELTENDIKKILEV